MDTHIDWIRMDRYCSIHRIKLLFLPFLLFELLHIKFYIFPDIIKINKSTSVVLNYLENV